MARLGLMFTPQRDTAVGTDTAIPIDNVTKVLLSLLVPYYVDQGRRS